MAFTGGSTKMTQAELDALIRAQQGQLATNALNQAANPYAVHQAQQGQLFNPNYYSQWSTATNTSAPQRFLREQEEREIRMQEREACAQLVIDMAEELNCPNLLHGVALAIKARGPK